MARQPHYNEATSGDRYGFRRTAQVQKVELLESLREHSERRHGENRCEAGIKKQRRMTP